MAPYSSPIAPRRGLARAGWSIISPSPSRSPEPVFSPPPAPEFNALGAQLVQEVCSSWTQKYMFTIRRWGFDGQASYHYECIFSLPTNDVPVPLFVLSVRFAIVVPSFGADPRLLYGFEDDDLRHEWKLARDAAGQWHAAPGQQFASLGHGRFEHYMDRMIHEKEQVRDSGVDMKTYFEETRLAKPPVYSEADSEEESEACESEQANDQNELVPATMVPPTVIVDQVRAAEDESALNIMKEALQTAGLYCDKVEPPSSLAELLASIFDAADEENVGELPHYEVARLLGATLPGFGLELWDIHLLMTSAQENDDGFIECKPFIQAAPEIVQALRKRRMAYRARGLPGVVVPQEAMKHCFTEEVTVTANQLLKVFEQCTQEDPNCGLWRSKHPKEEAQHHHTVTRGGRPAAGGSVNAGANRPSVVEKAQIPPMGKIPGAVDDDEVAFVGIKRRFCNDCISSLPERLSPQETMRLMQMLPEDEDGFVMIDELVEYLEHLRTDAMLNALVESDVLSLRTHLVLRFRRLGLGEDGKLTLWSIKEALLQADQVCLTRLQIHALLSLAVPDSFGYVNIAEFLGMCCVIIPHMFDAKVFVDTAERLILEHAESLRRAENEELAALGARTTTKEGEGEANEAVVEVDQETVERTLQQVLTLNDDAHRNPPALPPETINSILSINEKEIQATQLSTFEVTGFLAEMQMDAEGNVLYADHIKKWVPIIFEQRKNKLLGRYLEDGAMETLGIEPPDLNKLETVFPLLPGGLKDPSAKRNSQRRSSRLRERRDSFCGNDKNSQRSNGPSHREGSKGSPSANRRPSMLKQHTSCNMLSSAARRVSMSGNVSKNRSASDHHGDKSKENPPGRGFQRRKLLMALQAAAIHAIP